MFGSFASTGNQFFSNLNQVNIISHRLTRIKKFRLKSRSKRTKTRPKMKTVLNFRSNKKIEPIHKIAKPNSSMVQFLAKFSKRKQSK